MPTRQHITPAAVQCFLFLYLRMSRLPAAVRHALFCRWPRDTPLSAGCAARLSAGGHAAFAFLTRVTLTGGDAALFSVTDRVALLYLPAAAWCSVI